MTLHNKELSQLKEAHGTGMGEGRESRRGNIGKILQWEKRNLSNFAGCFECILLWHFFKKCIDLIVSECSVDGWTFLPLNANAGTSLTAVHYLDYTDVRF